MTPSSISSTAAKPGKRFSARSGALKKISSSCARSCAERYATEASHDRQGDRSAAYRRIVVGISGVASGVLVVPIAAMLNDAWVSQALHMVLRARG